MCPNALKTKNILFENNHCSYSKMQILERFVELLFCITAFLLNEFFYYAFIEIKRVMMLVSHKNERQREIEKSNEWEKEGEWVRKRVVSPWTLNPISIRSLHLCFNDACTSMLQIQLFGNAILTFLSGTLTTCPYLSIHHLSKYIFYCIFHLSNQEYLMKYLFFFFYEIWHYYSNIFYILIHAHISLLTFYLLLCLRLK